MSRTENDPLHDWRVGDHFWTPYNGTGTVLKLGRRAQGAPDALVEFAFRPEGRRWIVLFNFEKLAPGEPNRPSQGLQQVEHWQAVWHDRFGAGRVLDASSRGSAERVARIMFAKGGTREIAVGGGYLLAHEPASAASGPREDTFAVKGSPRPWPASRSLPYRLRESLTPLAAAARSAACLRALTVSLTARGDELPWASVKWLKPLEAVGNHAPGTVQRVRDAFGAFDMSTALYVRTANHSSRRWQPRPEGGVWLMDHQYPERERELVDEVKRVANVRPDRRYGLSAGSAPVLLQVAQWLEQEFGLPPQPPTWCHLRKGPLNGVATELARGLWSMGMDRPSDGPSGALCTAGPFDLLQPGDSDSTLLEYRDWHVLELLNRFLKRHSLAKHRWRRADVLIDWLPDRQAFGIGVALETEQPFGIAHHWFVKGVGPFRMQALRVSDWPDASPAMRVPTP